MSQGDIADRASVVESMEREAALKTRRNEGPAPMGECYFCGEELAGDLRWCDSECREDWEAERQQRARRMG